jgi:hypothetical protein
MSHNITAFVLGLQSAYEGEHAMFGLLSLTNSTSDDVSRVVVLLAFPPVVYEGSFFPTSSPKPVGSGVFDADYSNSGEEES